MIQGKILVVRAAQLYCELCVCACACVRACVCACVCTCVRRVCVLWWGASSHERDFSRLFGRRLLPLRVLIFQSI